MVTKKDKIRAHYSNMALYQLQRIKKEIEGREALRGLHQRRAENLLKQQNHMLRDQYHQIRTYLDKLPPADQKHPSKQHLWDRVNEIKKLKIVKKKFMISFIFAVNLIIW